MYNHDDLGAGGKFIRKFNAYRHIAVLMFVPISMAVIPCLAADQSTSAKDLTYITEQFPPYNYQVDDKAARHLDRSARKGLGENGPKS